MRLDVSQQMKMDQRMMLAPRMIQSMEILQLPLMALQERIEQEMLSNPVLEMEEPSAEDSSSENNAETNDAAEVSAAEQTLRVEESGGVQDYQRLDNMGDEFDDYMSRSTYVSTKRSSDEPDRKFEAMQNTAAHSQSLNEHLHDQWAFIEVEEAIKAAGSVIIDFIEETGYLNVSLESLEEHVKVPVTHEQMQIALALIQTLEPTGVGARNLAECMIIQLQSTPGDHTLEIELLTEHLKDLEMNRFPQVARKMGCTIQDIKDALKNVARLDPRPGLQIGRTSTQYIVPDVIVEYDDENDVYTARLQDGSTPNLRINTVYNAMIKQGKIPKDAKDFLQNSMRSARWLIESIEQRKTTLLRVVNHVLMTQRDFFDHGPQHLKPLPMVDVAKELGIHVGTVSRAVSGKYLQTPSGIHPLRSFFSGGTATSDGESVSWDAIKAKLAEIVENENKSKPFNDDELVEELSKHGITVARRTVAKYRSLMNIPPARRRKEYS